MPQGLVGSFDLQLATNSDFANLVLDTNGLGSSSLRSARIPCPAHSIPGESARSIEGGISDWASASFTTVPPVLHLIYPAGGETWQRFQVVTIRWEDNISENVALDIYEGGVLNRTFVASTPSTGSYTWTVGQFLAFPTGSDYTLKIRSTTNPDLYDFSPPFSMITNLTTVTIDGGSVTNSARWERPVRLLDPGRSRSHGHGLHQPPGLGGPADGAPDQWQRRLHR